MTKTKTSTSIPLPGHLLRRDLRIFIGRRRITYLRGSLISIST
jgi:hypothetical protein